MPYDLKKSKGGYYVRSKETGKLHSNKPMSKARAVRQMRAMYMHVKDAGGGRR